MDRGTTDSDKRYIPLGIYAGGIIIWDCDKNLMNSEGLVSCHVISFNICHLLELVSCTVI